MSKKKKRKKPTNGGIVHKGGGLWVMLCGSDDNGNPIEVELKGYVNPAGDYIMSDDQQETMSPDQYAAMQAGQEWQTAVDEMTDREVALLVDAHDRAGTFAGAETPENCAVSDETAEPVQSGAQQEKPPEIADFAERVKAAKAKRAAQTHQPDRGGWDWARSL